MKFVTPETKKLKIISKIDGVPQEQQLNLDVAPKQFVKIESFPKKAHPHKTQTVKLASNDFDAVSVTVVDSNNKAIQHTFKDGVVKFTPKEEGKVTFTCLLNGKPIGTFFLSSTSAASVHSWVLRFSSLHQLFPTQPLKKLVLSLSRLCSVSNEDGKGAPQTLAVKEGKKRTVIISPSTPTTGVIGLPYECTVQLSAGVSADSITMTATDKAGTCCSPIWRPQGRRRRLSCPFTPLLPPSLLVLPWVLNEN